METPKLYKVKLKNKQMLNERDIRVDFELIEPSEMYFKPGQFVNINVDENTFRSYSICSDSKQINQISIAASVDHDGVGSRFLKKIQRGDEVKLIGPSGRFHLPKPPNGASEQNELYNIANELVFIATGTGIAPFIPMWHKLEDLKYTGRISVYFGIRNEEALFFLDKLDYFKKVLNFSYKICVSRPSTLWNKPKGRVTKLLDLTEFLGKQYFLCGHPLMIEDMIGILHENNVLDENIFYEKFTVSTKK